jgi:hypothetical protein
MQTNLDELFSRDPLSLSDQDIVDIVQVLREQRAAWKLDASTSKRPKSATKARAEVIGLAKDIDLKDLGL